MIYNETIAPLLIFPEYNFRFVQLRIQKPTIELFANSV